MSNGLGRWLCVHRIDRLQIRCWILIGMLRRDAAARRSSPAVTHTSWTLKFKMHDYKTQLILTVLPSCLFDTHPPTSLSLSLSASMAVITSYRWIPTDLQRNTFTYLPAALRRLDDCSALIIPCRCHRLNVTEVSLSGCPEQTRAPTCPCAGCARPFIQLNDSGEWRVEALTSRSQQQHHASHLKATALSLSVCVVCVGGGAEEGTITHLNHNSNHFINQ